MANGSDSSPTAAIDAGPVALRRLGLGPARGHRARRFTGASDGERVHARRAPAARSGRAGRPRQLLRSRCLRPLGRRAAADRGRVGGAWPVGQTPTSATSSTMPARSCRGRGGGIFGDVWEWTGSGLSALSRLSPADGPVGEYNGKFMSGQLVLKGASCATPRGHSRPSYRNFFPPACALAIYRSSPCSRCLSPTDPAFRARCAGGAARHPIPASPRAGSMTAAGSELFDAITELPEYYPTRTETALLQAAHARGRRRSRHRRGGGRVRRRLARPRPRSCSRRSRQRPMSRSTFQRRLSARQRGALERRFPGLAGPCRSRPISPGRSRCRPRSTASRARLFPGLDHRQFRAAQRDRPAAPFPRHARHRRAAADRHGPGQGPVDRLVAAYDDPDGVTARVQPQPARTDQPRAWRHDPGRRLRPRSALERRSCRGSRCIW